MRDMDSWSEQVAKVLAEAEDECFRAESAVRYLAEVLYDLEADILSEDVEQVLARMIVNYAELAAIRARFLRGFSPRPAPGPPPPGFVANEDGSWRLDDGPGRPRRRSREW